MPPRSAIPRGTPVRTFDQPAAILRVLAHPVRLKLLETLARGEHDVGTLARHVRQPHHVVSQHLNLMRLHAIVDRRRAGRHIHYRLHDPHAATLLDWVHKRQFANMAIRDGEAI